MARRIWEYPMAEAQATNTGDPITRKVSAWHGFITLAFMDRMMGEVKNDSPRQVVKGRMVSYSTTYASPGSGMITFISGWLSASWPANQWRAGRSPWTRKAVFGDTSRMYSSRCSRGA